MKKQIVIIGGGAAGFFCALNLAEMCSNADILIIEKTAKLLSKVKISGGGRCNVTHNELSVPALIRNYPRGDRFLKKAFYHFSVADTIKWFETRGVSLKTEADGRMFPTSNQSQTIIDCFLREAERNNIRIRMQAEVQGIVVNTSGYPRFQLDLKDGRSMSADVVCIATGGYHKPAFGSILEQTGMNIIPPVPSLFTFNLPGHPIRALQGISMPDVKIKISGSAIQAEGSVLITHWGLSGPVVLRASAWGARLLAERQWHFDIALQWLPDYHEESLRLLFQQWRKDKPAQFLQGKNTFGFPARLWNYFLETAGIGNSVRWSELPAKEQNRLIHILCGQHFSVKDKTTFKEEFVTAGGIDLKQIHPESMMSRTIPGLFFAGEVIDVDGITGGFNFQNAWTTAFLAAHGIARSGFL